MRMLLRVSIPVDAGNAAAKDRTLGTTVEKILADLKPEAAYFFADDDGNGSGSIVFDMQDTSQIPDCRTVVPGIQCQSLVPAGDKRGGPREGRSGDWQSCEGVRKVGNGAGEGAGLERFATRQSHRFNRKYRQVGEAITKFQPHRTEYLRRFDRRGCAAELHAASTGWLRHAHRLAKKFVASRRCRLSRDW